ncbi:hypothetical protein [Paracoccus luteus]|uniref:hypothetical protein n=1 Tax=Paracoccus luteus TaxID=2508543 RepID=UPI0014301CC1|nr:hypothetical protein [Paracoccus luteus]
MDRWTGTAERRPLNASVPSLRARPSHLSCDVDAPALVDLLTRRIGSLVRPR